jgi:hypothetical protein
MNAKTTETLKFVMAIGRLCERAERAVPQIPKTDNPRAMPEFPTRAVPDA